jgi:hypothetical protein
MNLEEDLVQQDGLNMKRTNFTEEDIIALARQKGLKEVCEFNITCKDSQEKARRDYNISIKGIDLSNKKRTLFFELTEWEEIDNE